MTHNIFRSPELAKLYKVSIYRFKGSWECGTVAQLAKDFRIHVCSTSYPLAQTRLHNEVDSGGKQFRIMSHTLTRADCCVMILVFTFI